MSTHTHNALSREMQPHTIERLYLSGFRADQIHRMNPDPVEAELSELATIIHYAEERIHQAHRTVAENAIVAGNALLKVKVLVGHGNFRKWLKENCPKSVRTAQLYMHIALYLRDMPDMVDKIGELGLVKARDYLYYEKVHRTRWLEVSLYSLEKDCLREWDTVCAMFRSLKERLGPEMWEKWKDIQGYKEGDIPLYMKVPNCLPGGMGLLFPENYKTFAEEKRERMEDELGEEDDKLRTEFA